MRTEIVCFSLSLTKRRSQCKRDRKLSSGLAIDTVLSAKPLTTKTKQTNKMVVSVFFVVISLKLVTCFTGEFFELREPFNCNDTDYFNSVSWKCVKCDETRNLQTSDDGKPGHETSLMARCRFTLLRHRKKLHFSFVYQTCKAATNMYVKQVVFLCFLENKIHPMLMLSLNHGKTLIEIKT